MPADLGNLFLLLVLFQVKHMLADFCLQTRYMLANRMTYGHPGGLMHVGIHLIGSAGALAIVGTGLAASALMLVAEGIIHYHLDYAKARWNESSGVTPKDAVYWYAMGADQALHQLTYVGMAAVWATGWPAG